jgi:hypothetical protein
VGSAHDYPVGDATHGSCGRSLKRNRQALLRHDRLGPLRHKGILVLSRVAVDGYYLGLPETRDMLLGVILWNDVLHELQELLPPSGANNALWV